MGFARRRARQGRKFSASRRRTRAGQDDVGRAVSWARRRNWRRDQGRRRRPFASSPRLEKPFGRRRQKVRNGAFRRRDAVSAGNDRRLPVRRSQPQTLSLAGRSRRGCKAGRHGIFRRSAAPRYRPPTAGFRRWRPATRSFLASRRSAPRLPRNARASAFVQRAAGRNRTRKAGFARDWLASLEIRNAA